MNSSIDAVKVLISKYQADLVCVKDNLSRYIGSNDAFLSFFGFRQKDHVYHKTDYDLPCAVYAPQYISDDQEAMITGELQVIEPTVNYNGELNVLLSHKYQFYDETTQISGIVGFSKIMNIDAIKKFMPMLEHNDFSQLKISNALFSSRVNQYAKIPLTERELDVLYYLLHGLSQKQIASRLDLSVRTVEDYVDHVKAKLQCSNKNQLFDFALQYGLMSIIPKRLLC